MYGEWPHFYGCCCWPSQNVVMFSLFDFWSILLFLTMKLDLFCSEGALCKLWLMIDGGSYSNYDDRWESSIIGTIFSVYLRIILLVTIWGRMTGGLSDCTGASSDYRNVYFMKRPRLIGFGVSTFYIWLVYIWISPSSASSLCSTSSSRLCRISIYYIYYSAASRCYSSVSLTSTMASISASMKWALNSRGVSSISSVIFSGLFSATPLSPGVLFSWSSRLVADSSASLKAF